MQGARQRCQPGDPAQRWEGKGHCKSCSAAEVELLVEKVGNKKGLRVLKLSQWQRGLKLNSLAPQRERKSGNKQDMGKETRQALTSCRSAGLWHHTTPKATRQPLPRAPLAQFYGRAAAVTALSPQGWLFCLSPPSLLPTPSRGGRALRPPSASPRPRHSPTELRGAPQNPPQADPPAGAPPQGLTEQREGSRAAQDPGQELCRHPEGEKAQIYSQIYSEGRKSTNERAPGKTKSSTHSTAPCNLPRVRPSLPHN